MTHYVYYTSIDDCNETEISKIEAKNYLRERKRERKKTYRGNHF